MAMVQPARPIYFVRALESMDQNSMMFLRRDIHTLGEKLGVEFVFLGHDLEITDGRGAPAYAYSETVGDYSYTIQFKTYEELTSWVLQGRYDRARRVAIEIVEQAPRSNES